MTQWTTQQKQAIWDRGGALLLSASAGSGKTAVLVERAVQLICGKEQVDADRILILTFSNAAAAELRSRISLRLEQMQLEEPQNTRLRRQRLLLQRAPISTVSAYCMQLLRENFAAVDIPPDFKVADEAKIYEISQSVLAGVLEECYQEEDFRQFASVFGKARTDSAAAGALLDLYGHLRALPFFEQALEQIEDLYKTSEKLPDTVWGKELCQQADERLDYGIALLNQALGLCAQYPELARWEEVLMQDKAMFHSVKNTLANGRWNDALLRAQQHAFARFSPLRGFDGPQKDQIKQLREEAKELHSGLLKEIFVSTQEQFEQDLPQLGRMVSALARAVRRYDAAFFAAKLEEKVLDFSDFEHLALQLLLDQQGRRTPLAEQLSSQYAAVMVDEYQDTNALQDMLYTVLSAQNGENLFMVGDVKQSIYRFRKAMPEIFLEKKKSFFPYESQAHPAALTLPHNFRSAGGVVDGINELFCQLMTEQVGEVDYWQGEQLVAGAPDPDYPGKTCLQVVDLTENPKTGEADFVADTIASLVKNAHPVRSKTGGVRPCQYSDFCILLRSPAGAAAQYLAALEARGVPACADTDQNLLTQPAVQPLLALLRVLDNPAQDVPLAAFLASPMAHFTSGRLARLRAKTPRGSLWGALLADHQTDTEELLKLLAALRRQAAVLPVAKLCRLALEKTGYLLSVQVADAAQPALGRQNLGAVQDLVDWAAWYDKMSGGGLSGFLRMVDTYLAAGRPVPGQSSGQAADQVRIMSIHRSKGLEFPICILAQTTRQFNLEDLTAPLLRHSRLGLGMSLRCSGGARYTTVPQAAIRLALRREQYSEEMRVLYVALTRAQDQLLITAGLEKPKERLEKMELQLQTAPTPPPQYLLGCRSFAQWLLSAVLCHPDGEALRSMGRPQRLLFGRKGTLFVSLESIPPVCEQQPAPCMVHTAQPDEAFCQKLLEHFSWQDPNHALRSLPVKVSVSRLAHPTKGFVPRRPSFMYGEGLSAAERGTALHTLLQYADLLKLERDPQAEIARLMTGGWLLKAQAESIDRRMLDTFLQSELFLQMRTADKLLREYPFFLRVPAGALEREKAQQLTDQTVLVQGIADCIIIKNNKAVLLDYKTDRNKTEEELVKAYAGQLALYRRAVEVQLGIPVERCFLYAFSLGKAVELLKRQT